MTSRMKKTIKKLVTLFGKKYSSQLGINLKSSGGVFSWFLASILFGARIGEKIAINTYGQFGKDRLTTPDAIVRAGWDNLVRSLDAGGYVRYDFKTADKLLEVMRNLLDKYNGDLNILHGQSSNPRDLEKRLKGLGKGIGDVTVGIFLREMRGEWKKADPKPSPLVRLAARNLGIKDLKATWDKNKVRGYSFVNFETALLRLGKGWCRKKKCGECGLKNACRKK